LTSGSSANLYANVDAKVGGAGTQELGCVTSSEWTWIRKSVSSGQPVKFAGLALDVGHDLYVAPSASGVEISDVVLTPNSDGLSCQ
jgi:hypothetical protein